MMVVAFYLGLALVLVGVYWLIGHDIDRAVKQKDARRMAWSVRKSAGRRARRT